MITADKAYFESKNRKVIVDIEKTFEDAINKAIKKGDFSCTVDIDTDLPQEVRDVIEQEMLNYGYDEIKIPKYEEKPARCPSDQWRYWDTVTIEW